MKKKEEKKNETFNEINGIKWVQTTPEDFLFSDEIEKTLKTIQSGKKDNEKIFAYLKVGTINENYLTAFNKQKDKIENKNKTIKLLSEQIKKIINKKNTKIKDLMITIKRMKILLDENNINYSDIESKVKSVSITASKLAVDFQSSIVNEDEEVYEPVVEVLIDKDGNEIE